MDLLTLVILIILIGISGTLISLGVFFIPVGGAPAAMGTSTGLATGCEMLATGSGIAGLLITAGLHCFTLPTWPAWFIIVSAGLSSSVLIATNSIFVNLLLITGCGIPPALASKERDPVTKDHVKPYATPGTLGHGVPSACMVSGITGGFIGGVGGSLAATIIYRVSCGCSNLGEILGVVPSLPIQVPFMALAGILAVGIYFINANITAYSVRGVVEGWWDPKFKKFVPRTSLVCFIASIIFGIAALLVSVP